MKDVFVDGVLGAGFSKGAVRVRFYGLDMGQEVRQEHNLSLVMTVEGFLEVHAKFAEVMAQLKKSGLVKELPPAGGAGAAPVSPNFA
ncbi:hypothetical protein NNJEOMEG_01324 [Fundidesulfovibrio magnetotacticus]|uniref:Uncharacterized protein n=1 Tax=Fundidesulfovibrio magnetotacticus TaxID=2730080 RepID=A0A6V8LSE5_9BACT|nr:hypothetical protein [Fundidesulfovibrio magnetotacticus]GFK93491.1 hypothetical protein NNJEOMEG_01324 [Fundidesulfovibrio magnetotacticus]